MGGHPLFWTNNFKRTRALSYQMRMNSFKLKCFFLWPSMCCLPFLEGYFATEFQVAFHWKNRLFHSHTHMPVWMQLSPFSPSLPKDPHSQSQKRQEVTVCCRDKVPGSLHCGIWRSIPCIEAHSSCAAMVRTVLCWTRTWTAVPSQAGQLAQLWQLSGTSKEHSDFQCYFSFQPRNLRSCEHKHY